MSNSPWNRERFHYNSYGKPKQAHETYEEALLVAKIHNSDRLCSEKQFVHPYLCKRCNKWHVGRNSRAHKDTTLYLELGNRAYYNLVAENHKAQARRICRILARFKFLDVNYGNERLQLIRLKSKLNKELVI